jgi:hypothetical protein
MKTAYQISDGAWKQEAALRPLQRNLDRALDHVFATAAMLSLDAVPCGEVFGMPMFIDPKMEPDQIAFVDPTNGRRTEFTISRR